MRLLEKVYLLDSIKIALFYLNFFIHEKGVTYFFYDQFYFSAIVNSSLIGSIIFFISFGADESSILKDKKSKLTSLPFF